MMRNCIWRKNWRLGPVPLTNAQNLGGGEVGVDTPEGGVGDDLLQSSGELRGGEAFDRHF